MAWAADFETTTKAEDCRVWAWAISKVNEPDKLEYGNNIDSFMEYANKNPETYYFHNLKFDGAFIVDWLLRHNFRHVTGKTITEGKFGTLISDMGAWYCINICFPDGAEVKVVDSLKLITMPIKEMPKTFGLPEEKLEIDYTEEREVGHELTQEEKDYIAHDVIILSKSLSVMFSNGLTKLTAASNALNDFKIRYGKKNYKRDFGEENMNPISDKFIRMSYKGGFTYLNPKYKNKEVKEGRVYDVNSMYPWAMKYNLLPYGEPRWFKGQYKYNPVYPLYVQALVCEFELKPNHVPSLQVKHSLYADNEYLTESVEPTFLVLTSVDLKLFFDQYDVTVLEWVEGYCFKAKEGIFTEYIDYWYGVKEKSKRDGNLGMVQIAKLMLNSLYGKFGARITGRSKIPYIDEDKDKVCYKLTEEEDRRGGYLPIATFITSYCRDRIIRSAQICGDRFIYADTDSLHISGKENVSGLDIDNFRLGAFKLEEEFIRAKFIRQKTYMEVYMKDGKENLDIKCAGMPDNIKRTLLEEDFYEGNTFNGKLMPTIVPGGVILKETTFQIKKSNLNFRKNDVYDNVQLKVNTAL